MSRSQRADLPLDAPPGPPPDLELPDSRENPNPDSLPSPEETLHEQASPESNSPAPPSLDTPPDLIPLILPSSQVHLFSGAPGSGKTPLMAQFAASIFNQSPFLGRDDLTPRLPNFVGVVASDRIWKDQSAWYSLVGVPDIPHYSLTDDFANVSGKKLRNFKKGDRFDLFCTVMDRLFKGSPPPDSLVIVDPIALFLGGNLMDYDKVFSYMLDLNQFALRHSVTIIGLGHVGKQRQDPSQRYTRPQDRIVGTTAQTGCAGTSLYLAPPSETGEPWHEFGWVPRHAPAASMRLTPDASGLFFSTAELDIAPTRRGRHNLQKRTAFFDLIPKDGAEISVQALQERAEAILKIGRTMVYRYLSQLEAEGLIEEGAGKATRRRKLKLPN